ncbi:F-box only protein 6-like isoform X1 [Olea europaea var. sylvestris]|uniref:F-box only 6 n=2 Tax=Olea europaea subsp. europaea TaxID=158383 RepID=A0A8S0VKA1_OLEEU|nr:F-box only protein 6-like isoform X1 [Olea europaea var. sylvestris]CAA3029995.1 F-box only 6 [Olea europaea subsp. europaea]
MMEGLAMLRQLIGQLQEYLELNGSPPAVPPNYFLQFRPQSTPQRHLRWCFLDLDSSSVDYGCYNPIMTAGKSENLKMLEPGKPPPTKKARKESRRGKVIASARSTENMEQHIWKEFPEDLFEAVMARLPIATFFRFRSVCQKWNSLLNSQSFSQHCEQVEQSLPWFYTITHENLNTGAMYDPSLKKWHHLTVPALPTRSVLLPVASAGGLVCLLDIGHTSFYVCNPLTKSFKELPARSVNVWSRVAVGMTLNRKPYGLDYKILWVGCDGEYEIFDSGKNSWTCPGIMPSNIKLPLTLNFRSQAVSVDGTLYFMRSDPDGIVSYDMVSGVWKQSIIPAPLRLNDQTLAECGGRIMLVGLLTKNAATCVCIWELQKMTLLWKEVDRMPNILCLDFYGKHVRMTCLGNKGLLMLSLRSRQMNRLVTYDLSTGKWVKVPGCVLPHGRKRQWIACGTAFYPCLTASA